MQALQFNVNMPHYMAAKIVNPFFGNRMFYQGPLKTVTLVDIPEPHLPTRANC